MFPPMQHMRSGVWQFGLARVSSFSHASQRTARAAGATRYSVSGHAANGERARAASTATRWTL
jgi:hypothetical protein